MEILPFTSGRGDGRRGVLADVALWLPGAVGLACWLGWLGLEGGYFPKVWYPSALALLGLSVVVTGASGRATPDGRLARWVLGVLGAFVGWNFLSITWASSRGSALEASGALLLLFIGTWQMAILPWRRNSPTLLLGAWGVGVAVACAGSLARALAADDLGAFFTVPQYASPLGYPNASAALALMGAWPCLFLAAAPRVPAAVRAVSLGLTVFLAEFTFLPQSRGAIVAAALTVIAFVALAPNRLRLLLPLAVVAGALALTITPIVDVYDAALRGRHVSASLHHAAFEMVLTVLLATILGLAMTLVERKTRPSPRMLRQARRGMLAVAAATVLVGGFVTVVESHTIIHYVTMRWKVFKENGDTSTISARPGLRIAQSIPDLRYDYWRVAVNAFSEKPLYGVGAGNYAYVYAAHRQRRKQSKYAHDIWLRFLSETGIVGTSLFVACLALLTLGLLRVRRVATAHGRWEVTAAACVLTSFLIGASFDWLEEYPALVVPAFALPVTLLVAARAKAADVREPRRGLSGMGGFAAVGVVFVFALAALAPAYLSSSYVNAASSVWRSSPNEAFADLARAKTLNPLSAVPDLTAGTIAEDLGRPARARVAFHRALKIERSWYAYFELALLEAQSGNVASAESYLTAARSLDADDPVLVVARGRIAAHDRVDPAAFNPLFLRGVYKTRSLR